MKGVSKSSIRSSATTRKSGGGNRGPRSPNVKKQKPVKSA